MTLHATSVVTAAAHDAARLVASGGEVATAEAHVRALLGAAGDDATFEWHAGDDVVRLRVVLAPPTLIGGLGLDVVDRTVTVRTEAWRGG